MKSYLIYGILLLSIIASCKKSKQEPKLDPNANKLKENALVLDTVAVQSMIANLLVIDRAKTTIEPQSGDILLCAPNSKAKNGFLVRILNSTTSGNTITFTTEPASLNDAFSQLIINESYQDNFSSTINMRTASSVSLNFSHTPVSSTVSLNGVLKLNIPTVKLEYISRDGSLAPEKILILTEMNTEGSTLEITNSEDAQVNLINELKKEFLLPPITITIPIPTPVGVIPMPMIFGQTLIVSVLPLSISGKAEWAVLPKVVAKVGAKYENGQWSNLSNYTIDASGMPPAVGNFAPSLSLLAELTILKIRYELSPLQISALNAFFEIPNKLNFKVQPVKPNYTLNYSLDVTGGVQAKFWTGQQQTFSITGSILDKKILEGNFGYNIGDTAFGGIVFYVDSTRQHGLVSAFTDQSPSSTWYNASTVCSNYTGGGYNDWFLPSLPQLDSMYRHRQVIGNFNTGCTVSNFGECSYWTSTENGPDFAWNIYFVTGGWWSNYGRDGLARVRAIRKF